MVEAERRQLPYLFKLRQTSGVKRLFGSEEWEALGQAEVVDEGVLHEYAVLVTSLDEEVATLAQHYRDRADAENNFDELKNQWGGAGFTTQDRKRCRVLVRAQALIYHWWGLFTRLVMADQHAAAITTRPLLLHGIAQRTRHGHQTSVTIKSLHARARPMKAALQAASAFLARVRATAEQLTRVWRFESKFEAEAEEAKGSRGSIKQGGGEGGAEFLECTPKVRHEVKGPTSVVSNK